MNKKNFVPLSIVLSLFFVLTSCIKEPGVIIDTPSIVSEKIVWSTGNYVNVTGEYRYTSKLQDIVFYITNQMNYDNIVTSASAGLTDNKFSITIRDIVYDNKYYYYYKLDTGYGFVLTEIKPLISTAN